MKLSVLRGQHTSAWLGHDMNNSPRIIYIGAPEADASEFEVLARAEWPQINLLATNDRDVALNQACTANALIGHHFQFDETIVAKATQLRWIQSLTTGTDAIVKLKALNPHVQVTSTRGMHGPQMSELVFMHMLNLTRDMLRMLQNQANATWDRWPQPLLWGKTVVIVGVGAISEALALRCKAFGMTVVGVSGSNRLPEGFDAIYMRSEITLAASKADYLVLVVPLSPETENLVDSNVLAALPAHAYLVNVARGGVLDENALLRALRSKKIAGAALDVFRQQPLPADHVLWREPNVLISPLLGGMSNVYLEQAWPIVSANINHFLANKPEAMSNIVIR